MGEEYEWSLDPATGRPYLVDNCGRYRYVQPAQQPIESQASDYQPIAIKYPGVVMGHYQPYTDAPNSYPAATQPSYEQQKQRGYNLPHFGPGSPQSAYAEPDRPAVKHDRYRDAKQAWGKAGPSDSPYDKEHHDYKEGERKSVSSGKHYNDYVRQQSRVTKEDVANNKHLYGGRPLGTKEWHAQAAALAHEAVEDAQAVVDQRTGYNKNYIGYHNRGYLPGHQNQIQDWQKRATSYGKLLARHDNWIPQEDRVAQGRAARETAAKTDDGGDGEDDQYEGIKCMEDMLLRH